MELRKIFSQKNFDCHVHTPYSACCEDTTVDKLRQKAAALDINFAVTDHSAHLYLPRELAWSMMRDDFPLVIKAHRDSGRKVIENYIAKLRKNNIPVGLELDIYSDGSLVFEDDLFQELDLVIGSLHLLDTLLKRKPQEAVVEEFKKLTLELLKCGKVNILGHPFRMLHRADIPVHDELIHWVVDKSSKYNVALEINSHYQFPESDLTMIEAAISKNVLLIKGSDAHCMSEFGDYSYQNELLQMAYDHSCHKREVCESGPQKLYKPLAESCCY